MRVPTKFEEAYIQRLEAENQRLLLAIRKASEALKVPAAEYVPAMVDAWEILDRATRG